MSNQDNYNKQYARGKAHYKAWKGLYDAEARAERDVAVGSAVLGVARPIMFFKQWPVASFISLFGGLALTFYALFTMIYVKEMPYIIDSENISDSHYAYDELDMISDETNGMTPEQIEMKRQSFLEYPPINDLEDILIIVIQFLITYVICQIIATVVGFVAQLVVGMPGVNVELEEE